MIRHGGVLKFDIYELIKPDWVISVIITEIFELMVRLQKIRKKEVLFIPFTF